MYNIGIFAGSFDPVHLGHRSFVEQSINMHGLDKVLILVEKKPRYKTCFALYAHRKNMAGLAFADNPKITIYEPASGDFPITSSLPSIRAEYADAQLYLLIGEDVAKHIDSWENAGELLKNVKIMVGKRDNKTSYGQASSAKIRSILKGQGNSTDLDLQVLSYINQKNLYR